MTSLGASASQRCPLLVVVLNYRTPELTLQCLKSLAEEIVTVPGAQAVVVDNDSQDGSAEAFAQAIEENAWSSWLRLVVAPKNLGFAGGNNLGVRESAPAEFILLLNSDTIVHRGVLSRCLEVMREHPEAGAMSCRVLNADGTIQNVTRRFPSPLRMTCAATGLPYRFPRWFGWADCEDLGWDREREARDVDWLGGAFLFIRAAALPDPKTVLDEDFFFYGEDVAFSHRLSRLGWTRRYDPVASIVHLGGASSDPSRMPEGERAALRFRARYLVVEKCYGKAAARWVRWVDASMTALRWVREKGRGERGLERASEYRRTLRLILRLEAYS